MKTPREILLERHRAAAPKLDAIRRVVVSEEFNQQDAKAPGVLEFPASRCLGGFHALWRELVLPSRRIWAGLATVWILIFAINLSQRDTVSSVTGKPVHGTAVMMSWQTEQRLMNELLADRTLPANADRLRPVAPKPRTENDGIFLA